MLQVELDGKVVGVMTSIGCEKRRGGCSRDKQHEETEEHRRSKLVQQAYPNYIKRPPNRPITQWRDERNAKKEEAIRARLEAVQMQEATPPPEALPPNALPQGPPGSPDEMEQRIAMLKSLAQQQRHSMNFVPPFVN